MKDEVYQYIIVCKDCRRYKMNNSRLKMTMHLILVLCWSLPFSMTGYVRGQNFGWTQNTLISEGQCRWIMRSIINICSFSVFTKILTLSLFKWDLCVECLVYEQITNVSYSISRKPVGNVRNKWFVNVGVIPETGAILFQHHKKCFVG